MGFLVGLFHPEISGITVPTLEVQLPFLLGLRGTFFFGNKGLSSSKRNHHVFKGPLTSSNTVDRKSLSGQIIQGGPLPVILIGL